MTSGDTSELLGRIDHIIVLMMENRSFDHVFGYLNLPEYSGGAPPVNGLSEPHANRYTGTEFSYPEIDDLVHHTAPLYPPEQHQLDALVPLWQDPPHGAASQAIQINGGAMDGFVNAYAARLHDRVVASDRRADNRRPRWRVLGYPMRYLTPTEVPVYDYLART